jgi:GDPmannose 4,6-dehydratase
VGLSRELKLGNLDAKRDWGYAPEYVEAIWLMLQNKEPKDYVIATGEAHAVREFVEKSFDVAKLNWQDYVKVDKRFLRPLDVPSLRGDYSLAKGNWGGNPKRSSSSLLKLW